MGKSIKKRICATSIALSTLVVIEVILGFANRNSDLIANDTFAILFVFVNVMAMLAVSTYQNIPYSLFCAMYGYVAISIVITMLAYLQPNEFIGMFKQLDTYTFHNGAISIIENTDYWYIDTYTKVLALLYSNFGMSYRLGVGVNIIASLISVIMLYKILELLKVDKRTRLVMANVFLLMPFKWELSLFPIREAIPTCLVSTSLYYFIKWYISAEYKWGYRAIIVAVTSMAFHSGLIFFPLVYMCALVLYDPQRGKVHIIYDNVANFIALGILMGAICYFFSDEVFSKFPTVDSVIYGDCISQYSNYWIGDDGGSTYLKWLSYDNAWDIVIQSPLRSIYFAFAPVPWEWRGCVDMLAFIAGGLPHFCVIGYIWGGYKKITCDKRRLLALIMMIYILEVMLYGVTTFNSGTAIRHRAKIEILIFIMAGIITLQKDGEKQRSDVERYKKCVRRIVVRN